jgi:hypothetical protein
MDEDQCAGKDERGDDAKDPPSVAPFLCRPSNQDRRDRAERPGDQYSNQETGQADYCKNDPH